MNSAGRDRSAEFAGRVALVTGAAGGIGRASALELAARGAAVMVGDIDERGEATAREIREAGGLAASVVVDVGDAESVHAMVDATIAEFGRLDFAHNNAGVSAIGRTADLEPEQFERVIRVNLLGVFHCIKYEIPRMLEVGGGAIVNTASMWAFTGSAGKSAYAASKHGVAGLTRTAAVEYGAEGLRINAVAPGPIETAMTRAAPDDLMARIVEHTAVKRIGAPEEIARAVAWLCSDESSYVNGTVMPVDGGWLAS
ncbi:SDR family oxidoreductase [Herbiconiux sp. VKM Ac-1786]|uniref:SDR family NAD(P)-dependent oxidoreductase n=1 Tax=Herbiconiux sp. VKM Ac-1786 TaxID=2783824 RepID=UPI00188BB1FF|nr:SDR family oxidoreductase [Herbiconiux sp. VKM Ac-1786]